MQFNIVERDGRINITVILDGEMYVADETHANIEAIRRAVLERDESVVDLFDVGRTLVRRFERLSRSVTISGEKVFYDGVEQNNALTEHLVQAVSQGVEDLTPLVNFYEKIEANPNPHSREHLYRWLDRRFAITPEGNIIGYRGLNGNYTSKHAGPGIVNGVEVNGNLDNSPGNVIELPRDQVTFDPAVGCAFGLHVGTYEYARGWAGYDGKVVEVEVDPRDFVSVPTDCNDAKARVCRLTVLRDATQERTEAIVSSGYVADDDEDDVCGWCYENRDDCERGDYCDF